MHWQQCGILDESHRSERQSSTRPEPAWWSAHRPPVCQWVVCMTSSIGEYICHGSAQPHPQQNIPICNPVIICAHGTLGTYKRGTRFDGLKPTTAPPASTLACHPLLIRRLDLSPRPFLHGARPCYVTLRPRALLRCGCWASPRLQGSTPRYFRDFAPAVPLTLDLRPHGHPLRPSLLHNSLHSVQPHQPECFFTKFMWLT